MEFIKINYLVILNESKLHEIRISAIERNYNDEFLKYSLLAIITFLLP